MCRINSLGSDSKGNCSNSQGLTFFCFKPIGYTMHFLLLESIMVPVLSTFVKVSSTFLNNAKTQLKYFLICKRLPIIKIKRFEIYD